MPETAAVSRRGDGFSAQRKPAAFFAVSRASDVLGCGIKKTILLLLLALTGILAARAEQKPILLVVTNHGELGNTGKPTGFFLSEAAHLWEVFRKAGYPVEFGSPKGGFAPLDPTGFEWHTQIKPVPSWAKALRVESRCPTDRAKRGALSLCCP